MTDFLENIVEETENLKIEEPKFEKWNELPSEIKLECMKTLDFKTRWSLYNTSHTERALIDSQRVKIYKMVIKYYCFQACLYNISCASDEQVERYCSPEYTRFVLEHAVFENLEFVVSRILEDLTDFPLDRVISVKNLKINCNNETEALHLLEKVNDRLDSLVINVHKSLVEFLSLPQVANARSVEMSGISSPRAASELAQIWIDRDTKIGSKFRSYILNSDNFNSFTLFADKFSSLIISRTNRFIRIRTNNEEKHILLQLGTSTFGKLNGTEEFLRMSIISSQQSEVDTSEKWVRKLAETSDNEASFDEEDYDSSDDFDYYDYIYRPEEYYNDNCW